MSNSHSLTESETFFIQLFVTNLWTCYFQTLAHQPLEKLNLKINKYFESIYKKTNIAPMHFQQYCREHTGGTRCKSSSKNVIQSTPSPSYYWERTAHLTQLQTQAANEGIWWSENTFASMTFLKELYTCFMAIFPKRSSQGGNRSMYFYIESATYFQGDVQHL